MRSSAILSTGSFVPENLGHNEDLGQVPEKPNYLNSQKSRSLCPAVTRAPI